MGIKKALLIILAILLAVAVVATVFNPTGLTEDMQPKENAVIPNNASRLIRKKVSFRNQRRKGKYNSARQTALFMI